MIFALWKRVYVYITVTLHLYKIHHHDTLQKSFTIIHPLKNIHTALQTLASFCQKRSVLFVRQEGNQPTLTNTSSRCPDVKSIGAKKAKKYGPFPATKRASLAAVSLNLLGRPTTPSQEVVSPV